MRKTKKENTMKLEKTKNYKLFAHNNEQRPIDERHAKRIAENMGMVGFLPSKPIQCYRKNGKLVIVDGHHRFEAAKIALVDIFYVVENEASQQTMGAENLLVKKWTMEDFARLYALRGDKNYIDLMQYSRLGVPISMAASMLHHESAASGNANNRVQDGTFKIKSHAIIDQVVNIMIEFAARNEAVKSRQFISAMSKCLMWDGFDVALFVRRLRDNSIIIERTSNEGQMLSQIESIYNFRSRQPVPLRFYVEAASRERKAKIGK